MKYFLNVEQFYGDLLQTEVQVELAAQTFFHVCLSQNPAHLNFLLGPQEKKYYLPSITHKYVHYVEQ